MFLAFCLGVALDLYHLSLQYGNSFLGKRCDTYCEILSSQAVISLRQWENMFWIKKLLKKIE